MHVTVIGDDYQPDGTELVFSTQQQQLSQPGESITECINIDIVDDSRVEGEHMFSVEIVSVSPSSVVQCSPNNSASVHIIDDDGIENSTTPCMQHA